MATPSHDKTHPKRPTENKAAPSRPRSPQRTNIAGATLALQGMAGNKAVAALVAQRFKTGTKPSAPAPVAGVASSAFQAELRKRVAALPQLGEKIPPPEKIQSVGQEAAQVGDDLKFAQGRPALAKFTEQTISAPVQEPSGGEAGAMPLSSTPGRIASFARSAGAKAKAFFSSAKNALTPTAVTKGTINNYAETAAKGSYAGATTGASILGQAGNVSGGLAAIGQNAAAAAVAATPAITAIAHIAPLVGIFLAPMTLCLNVFQAGKAWDRGARLKDLIQTADGKARAQGHPLEIIAAVRGAVEQKYEQASRKLQLATASALSLTGGLILLTVALASNPVGWVIGAALAAMGGAWGFFISARAIYRSFKKKDKGKKRKEIAAALVKGLHDGDALAAAACRELGLNPETVKSKGGDALLFARLTTG